MGITLRQLDFILHMCLIAILLAITVLNHSMGGFLILASQFFVGIFQVLSSIGRTIKYHSFDKAIQKMIVFYWAIVVLYGSGWIFILLRNLGIDYTMPYLFSAWGIALYYCYITYRIGFPNYIKSHLDI